MEVRQILGERVRRRRMALGLNQTAFADKVGIPVPTLSSIEHGHQSIYVERAVQLAQALDVSTDYLLGLSDGFVNLLRLKLSSNVRIVYPGPSQPLSSPLCARDFGPALESFPHLLSIRGR